MFKTIKTNRIFKNIPEIKIRQKKLSINNKNIGKGSNRSIVNRSNKQIITQKNSIFKNPEIISIKNKEIINKKIKLEENAIRKVKNRYTNNKKLKENLFQLEKLDKNLKNKYYINKIKNKKGNKKLKDYLVNISVSYRNNYREKILSSSIIEKSNKFNSFIDKSVISNKFHENSGKYNLEQFKNSKIFKINLEDNKNFNYKFLKLEDNLKNIKKNSFKVNNKLSNVRIRNNNSYQNLI